MVTQNQSAREAVERLNGYVEQAAELGQGAIMVASSDLRAVLAALRLSSGGQGWQDIATAPRDGTPIIAYSQDERGNTGLSPFVSLCAWHPDAGFCTCELRSVTHWMPLPEPPSVGTPSGVNPNQDHPQQQGEKP